MDIPTGPKPSNAQLFPCPALMMFFNDFFYGIKTFNNDILEKQGSGLGSGRCGDYPSICLSLDSPSGLAGYHPDSAGWTFLSGSS